MHNAQAKVRALQTAIAPRTRPQVPHPCLLFDRHTFASAAIAQIESSQSKQKGLDLLGFVRPNRAFSMSCGRKNKKNPPASQLVCKTSQTTFLSSPVRRIAPRAMRCPDRAVDCCSVALPSRDLEGIISPIRICGRLLAKIVCIIAISDQLAPLIQPWFRAHKIRIALIPIFGKENHASPGVEF
jgi:hypothetical protein